MESLDNKDYQDKMEEKLNRAFKKEEKSVTGFFIRNFRFTYLIIITVFILGIFSYLTIPKEADPEVKVPFAVVNTVYPGSNPTDVEDLVTNKIEDEIKNLDHLKIFNSSSNQGFSSIFVEFDAEADMEESIADLKDAVDKAKYKLPEDANDPAVVEINFSDYPIITYAVSGPYPDNELKRYAEKIKDEIEVVKNVSKAEIIGGAEKEFQILLDQSRMSNFNISLDQVVAAISRTNISIPAGSIKIDDFKYNIRVSGKFQGIKDLNNVVVSTFSGSPVFISDLAEIKDSFKEKGSISRLAAKGEEAQNTISIQVYKKTGGNIINIVKATNKVVAKAQEDKIVPEDIIIKKLNDISEFIKDDLYTLGFSGLQTFILITLILLLALSFRGSLITALSVPISFLMAFIFLKIQGMSLNGMVLFSLVLSLGLMVDNAIIIIEGIDEYVKQHKKTIYEAAILSVWNFKWPIISGTMTTVCAFVPMFLVSGIMGEYMSILPKTIIVTLLSSLFTAIIIIPTLATRFLKRVTLNGNGDNGKKRFFSFSRIIKKIKKVYVEFLNHTLPSKKKRRRLIIIAWILFVLAVAVPASGFMKVEMFGNMDFDYFYVNAKLPAGSSLEKTDELTRKIEEKVALLPELDNYVVSVGQNMNMNEGSSGLHKTSLIVNLVPPKERKRKSYEIATELRKELKDIQGLDINVDELSAGPPTGAPIEVRILSNDFKKMMDVSNDIKNYFEEKEGVINARLSAEDTAGEFVFSIDRQKADFHGLSIASIASTLRNVVYGMEVASINVLGEDVDVVVKYKKDNFKTPDDLSDVLIFNHMGEAVSLDQVASIKLEPSILSIDHRDGERVMRVSADLEAGVNLQKVLKEFDNNLGQFEAEGIKISVGGEVEDIDKSFREIFLSMILAVILIFAILILQFNSFKQPFIIIFSLPLSIIGVIIGLNLTGEAFSFLAFIGIVALAGIVVNDAIVLIDKINKNIKNGMEYQKAIVDGGVSRMQPIFLTSLTTVAGIFPLIWASEMWRGFSITVISGLIFSTMLTLVVMPVLYYGMCYDKKMND